MDHHFGRFSKKRDLQSNWFSSENDLCSFFLAQELTNIKNCLGTIKDLSIGYQLPKRQNLCQIPYGFRSITKFSLEPVFRLSDSYSKSCFNLAVNREADTLVIANHFQLVKNLVGVQFVFYVSTPFLPGSEIKKKGSDVKKIV